MRQVIFLFDVDGVLVKPYGYRRAVQATLDFFAGQCGFDSLYPGEDTLLTFEAHGISSEWDFIPILLAGALDAIQEQYPGLELPGDLLDACRVVRAQQIAPPVVKYLPLIEAIAHWKEETTAAHQPAVTYAEAAYQLSRQGRLFSRLTGRSLLESVLAGSREIEFSIAVQVFQQFTLGSREYEQVYGLRGLVRSPSLLKQHDAPLLSPALAGRLLDLWRHGSVALAAYTARPSLPAGKNSRRSLYYSPEAEAGLQLAGLEEIPLVGQGEVWRVCELTGRTVAELAKPQPAQALGAIGAAIRREALTALQAAERFYRAGDDGYFRDLTGLEIHVFEDTAGGLRAVQQAAKDLEATGIPVRVVFRGIAQDAQKQAALEKAGAVVYPDVNAAVIAALQDGLLR